MGPSAENRENEQLVYSQEGSRASTELAQSLQIDISEIGPNNLTAKEQEAEDERMFQGVKAFFCNQYSEAQDIFAEKADFEPLYALGRGCISFLKAVTTFNEDDITLAIKHLSFAETLASTQLHASKPSFTSSFTKFFSGRKHFMANGQLRSMVIKAESVLLIALIQLFQESLVSYGKAALNLRRGYKSYEQVWDEMNKSDFPGPVDRHTKGGVEFGFGTCNLVLSFLPGKIIKLIAAAIGYRGNKELGVQLVNDCLRGRGIRSPLASILFAASYTILTSFVPVILGTDYIPKADSYIQDALQQFPGSDFFTFFAGRNLRLKRELQKSTVAFKSVNQSLATGFGAELRRLCDYELGMNYAMMLEWEAAASCFANLAKEGYWSPAFFTYFQASCLVMVGKMEEAIKIYSQVAGLVVRKFGGRTILIEQYVTRKVKQYAEDDFKNIVLPGLEIMLIWNSFGCMTQELLLKCMEMTDARLNALEEADEDISTGKYDVGAMLRLIKASILNQLKRFSEAHECLTWIFDRDDRIKEDKFVLPFAYWEAGLIAYLKGNLEKAHGLWEEAGRISGYEFELRLALRLHLGIMKVNDLT
ncbi:1897_t:CDS:10, partial [Paraglomus brasilianum]